MTISGLAAAALKSLTADQIRFIQALPKAELHAHLNGCIPIAVLQELAQEYIASPLRNAPTDISNEEIEAGIKKLLDGPSLNDIGDFFPLFPAIYALTSAPQSLSRATRAVVNSFLDGEHPQCQYLELRTTPKKTAEMTREIYLRTVLTELARYGKDKVGLIVSLDRRMGDDDMGECVEVATRLKAEGQNIVGVDLCGDPSAGSAEMFRKHFEAARQGGLGLTLHIAEAIRNTAKDTLQLLSFRPDRLGHATFLNEETKNIVLENKICIELCLSSNLLCKTVPTLESHHIQFYLQHNHPIAICTDDTLPFRTSLLAEYALLMAHPPLGLGMANSEVKLLSEMSMDSRFNSSPVAAN